jgi:glycosyltransferase involved in cell wall biosynthesis
MLSKIRILHCIETISSGGVERVRLTFAQGLDYSRYELKIVCTQAKGNIQEELEAMGIEIIQVGQFKSPFEGRKYMKVLEVIQRFRPHIIHGAVFEGMSMAAVAGTWGRVPIRILEETSEPITRSRKSLFLQRLLLFVSDGIIGISPTVVQFLKEKAHFPARKIYLINNGVNVPSIVPKEESNILKSQLRIRDTDIVIGSVGRMYDQVKRFSDIIEALKILDLPQVKLLLVGDGPDWGSMKLLVHKLGLEERVIFLGQQANPHPYFAIMNIFCIASAQEGFGLVAVEAMMHSLPVIATQVGGLKDIVQDGRTGYLVPSFSPVTIAEKIRVLIENPRLKQQMGGEGRIRALNNYSADRYGREVERLYLKLLRSKGIYE